MKKCLLLPAVLLACSLATLHAQWISTQGPYGGYVYQTLSNNDYVFAVKFDGLYRSADAGLHWERCAYTGHLQKIAVDGPNILVSGGDNALGVFQYSPDNGDHWLKVGLPAGTPYRENFLIRGGGVWFTYLGKLWYSPNLGQNWQDFELPGEPFQSPKLLGIFENRVYLGNRTRLLVSDNGLDWSYLGTVPGNAGNNIQNFFREGNTAVMQSAHSLARSLDGGAQWEIAATDNPDALGANTDFSYHNGVFYASTGKPMLRSADQGLSWETIDITGPKLYFHSQKDGVILGHILGLGMLRSTDGGESFTPANHGLGGGDVMGLALQDKHLFVWSEPGILRQETGQYDWDAAPVLTDPALIGSFVSIFPFNGALFARADHGVLRRSDDGGQSWDILTAPPGISASDFVEFNAKNDTIFLSSESAQTFLSTNLGEHWSLLNPQVDAKIGASMQDLAVQGGAVFVSGEQHIFRSTDGMESWAKVGGDFPFGASAERIRLFATPGLLFAYVDLEQIFRSADGGETWVEVFLPFAPWNTNSQEFEVVFAETNNATLAFFERQGVFVSLDGGLNWDTFNENIPYPELCTSFALNADKMWVGAYYNGLFERSTLDLENLSTHNPAAAQSRLRVFPNPSSGRFHCKIPDGFSGEARLHICDVRGRVVSQQSVEARQTAEIDLSAQPPGVYWLRATTSAGIFLAKVLKI